MANLDRIVAGNIVTRTIAVYTSFPQSEIRSELRIANNLKIDQWLLDDIRRDIAHQVESIGFRATFSRTDLSRAETVGDLIHVVMELTESGGPE